MIDTDRQRSATAPTQRSWDCASCGATVTAPGHGNDTTCTSCGTEYNAFGQRLRSDWRDNPSNYDDDIDDLEGFELSQLAKEMHE